MFYLAVPCRTNEDEVSLRHCLR